MNSVRCPQHSKSDFFPFYVLKIRLFWKKVCYKVSLFENYQRQSCMVFTGLSSGAQMVGGRRPFLPEILGQSDPPLQKRRFPIYIHSVSGKRSEESSPTIHEYRMVRTSVLKRGRMLCKAPLCVACIAFIQQMALVKICHYRKCYFPSTPVIT